MFPPKYGSKRSACIILLFWCLTQLKIEKFLLFLFNPLYQIQIRCTNKRRMALSTNVQVQKWQIWHRPPVPRAITGRDILWISPLRNRMSFTIIPQTGPFTDKGILPRHTGFRMATVSWDRVHFVGILGSL